MNKLLKSYRKKYELFLFDRPIIMIQESADMNTIIENTLGHIPPLTQINHRSDNPYQFKGVHLTNGVFLVNTQPEFKQVAYIPHITVYALLSNLEDASIQGSSLLHLKKLGNSFYFAKS